MHLVGRVSGEVTQRTMPSGDPLVSLRVVTRRSSGGTTRVDTIDVAVWTARPRATAVKLADGDRVEVTGALRRRFFRTGAGSASRYEVEAITLRRVR